VIHEEPEKVLQARDDGEPTGDGATCSWAGTTLQVSDRCGAVSIPSGYGPYDLGEDFPSPDGCNECTCSERGIMCTVRDCAGDDSKGDGAADRIACPEDGKVCADGSTVVRQGADCEFAPCPGDSGADPALPVEGEPEDGDGCAIPCTKDAKICPDGSAVGREGSDCEFAPCPDEGTACTDDAMECPDGRWVGRTGPNCEFVCDEIACTADAKLCPDGSYVSRQAPDCQFAPCPYEPCADKACGEACNFCPPEESDCVEDAALKFCNQSGECAHLVPQCN
jgi:hypothetical protein